MSDLYSILRINQLTTNIHMAGGSATQVFLQHQGWTPEVARRNQYHAIDGAVQDVDEEITFNVTDGTLSVHEVLELLEKMVADGARWAQGDSVDRVQVAALPQWSEGTEEWKATIIGPPSRGPVIELPRNYVGLLAAHEIEGVRLRFRRHGLWLYDAGASVAATGGVINSNNRRQVAFGSNEPVPNPLRILFTNTDGATYGDESGFIVMCEGGRQIITEGEAFSTSPGGSTGSGDNARGGSFLRISGRALNTVDEHQWGMGGTPLTTTRTSRVGLLASMRSPQGTQWAVSAATRDFNNNYNTQTAPIIVSSTAPQVYALGTSVSGQQKHRHISIYTERLDGLSTDELDIDYIVVFELDNPLSRAIKITPQTTLKNIPTTLGFGWYSNALNEPEPEVILSTVTLGMNEDEYRYTIEGNPFPSWQDSVVDIGYYHTAGTSWTILNTAETLRATWAISAQRHIASLVMR